MWGIKKSFSGLTSASLVIPLFAHQERAPTMEEIEESAEIDYLTEGTLHQLALGDQAKRKHFFSPLNPVYAEAVHKDAETVVYTSEEEV